MTNQTISTLAFIGAAGAVALYIFKVLPEKQALMLGAGLIAVGFITQPATT
jgi:hypothetical protein